MVVAESKPLEIGEMEIHLINTETDSWRVEISSHVFYVKGRENISKCIETEIIGPIRRMVALVESDDFKRDNGAFVLYTRLPNRPHWIVSSGRDPADADPDIPWSRIQIPVSKRHRRRVPTLPSSSNIGANPDKPAKDAGTPASDTRKPKKGAADPGIGPLGMLINQGVGDGDKSAIKKPVKKKKETPSPGSLLP